MGSSKAETEPTLLMFLTADFQWPVDTDTPMFLLEVLLGGIFCPLHLIKPYPRPLCSLCQPREITVPSQIAEIAELPGSGGCLELGKSISVSAQGSF